MDSNINYPLLAWSQRRQARKPFEILDLQIIAGQFIALSMWAIPCTYIPDDNMGPKSLIPMIMTLSFYYAIYYSAQLLF
jgi:hypothetical protein